LFKDDRFSFLKKIIIFLFTFFKGNFKTLNEYLNTLSKEKESISKWNVGGQIYLDFIRLNQKADVLFTFSQEESQEVSLIRF
jgi:hypothetical protein